MLQPSRDSGFTLIELLVVMSLMAAMMTIAVSGWASWAHAKEHEGAAQEIQSLLRSTQQTAVSGGAAMCVEFDAPGDRVIVYEGACASASKEQRSVRELPSRVEVASPQFKLTPTSTPEPRLTLFARGTASPGDLEITREGSDKKYTLTVEGLSGHVSMS